MCIITFLRRKKLLKIENEKLRDNNKLKSGKNKFAKDSEVNITQFQSIESERSKIV